MLVTFLVGHIFRVNTAKSTMLGRLFSLLDQAYPWYNRVMRLDKLLGQAAMVLAIKSRSLFIAVRYATWMASG